MKPSFFEDSTVLIVEDDDFFREELYTYLESHFEVIVRAAATGEEALSLISCMGSIVLLITDFNLNGDADGLDVARAMKAKNPEAPILLITGTQSVSNSKSTC